MLCNSASLTRLSARCVVALVQDDTEPDVFNVIRVDGWYQFRFPSAARAMTEAQIEEAERQRVSLFQVRAPCSLRDDGRRRSGH